MVIGNELVFTSLDSEELTDVVVESGIFDKNVADVGDHSITVSVGVFRDDVIIDVVRDVDNDDLVAIVMLPLTEGVGVEEVLVVLGLSGITEVQL